MKYIFGNWKENKNLAEASKFLSDLKNNFALGYPAERRLVILPPNLFLIPLFQQIESLRLPVELGVQDVSAFEQGAYTGEVSARMVAGLANYALLGHSERRRFFGETPGTINEKIKICQKYKVTPLVCLRGLEDLKLLELNLGELPVMIVYEDPQEIGGEKLSDPKKILEFCRQVRLRFSKAVRFIYGGSIGPENALGLWQLEALDGLLVGHHSLEAESLAKITLA